MQKSTQPHTNRIAFFNKAAILSIIALYLAACFSPLRLEYDSIRYFAIKDCLEQGCPPGSAAARDFLPYGYPVLLVILSKTGLLDSFFIAFVNGLFVACSLWLTRKIMRVNRPILFYTAVLLNWTFIKLFAYPLSEMQYLFLSSISLYCFYQYTRKKKWIYLLLSVVLGSLAVFTRTIGIALIATLIIALAWEHRKLFRSKTFRIVLYTAAVILIAAMIFVLSKLPGITHYASDFLNKKWFDPFLHHIQEWGQLLVNIPIQKMNDYTGNTAAALIFLVAGGLLIAWLIYALVQNRKDIPPVILIYFIIYSLIIFKWPHADPRFWVPLLPLMAACILNAPLPFSNRLSKKILFIYPLYLLIGLVAFGYSFYTQFNKTIFARTQANGIFRKEYETYFFGRPINDTNTPMNEEVLRILEKYD